MLFITLYFTSISHLTSLHTAVSLVKTSESVLTTSKIAPHLSQRQMIKLVPDNWTSSAESDINFKYVLIDLLNSQKKPALKRLVNQIKNDSEFNLTYAKDQVYLFTRMH